MYAIKLMELLNIFFSKCPRNWILNVNKQVYIIHNFTQR